VLNIEAEVITYLLQQVDAGDFKVNKLDAVVIPKTSYVFQGTDFTAEVFLAASDTTQIPKIYIGRYETFKTEAGFEDYKMVGNYEEIPVVGGRGLFTRKASSIGKVPWSGLLEVTYPDGSKIRKPFQHEYEVAAPNVVISLTKMDVFYKGVDNPVKISISGVSMDKIEATMTGGQIKRSGDSFIVNPSLTATTCEINVTATVDGIKTKMGTQKFRVKPVPPPIPTVDGVTSKTVPKNVLATALFVAAKTPPDFDFDMPFRVTEFTISATVGGLLREFTSKSQMLTDEQKNMIQSLRSGQTVAFTNIKAVGPAGNVLPLVDLVYKIQ
jgi:gliding motility-associated protein GldM